MSPVSIVFSSLASRPLFRYLPANGTEFAVLQRGRPEAPLVLCLHGFPDCAQSFLPLLDSLSGAGYRAVAVSMRGYLPSSIPARAEYRPTVLARDVIALIDHLGADQAVVVGHDWGAVASYAAAALRPDRVRAIVAAAIPHLRRFLLRPSLDQLWRSRYMLQFQNRGIEAELLDGKLRALRTLAQRWSPGLDVDRMLAPVWAGFSEPGRLTAALSYYRALPAALMSSETWKLLLAPTPVPALVIHGAEDGCIGAEMFAGQSHLFAAGLRELCIPGAGHFMHIEQPQQFSAAVLDFLGSLDG